jgi:hypothetical protein
MRQVAPSVLRIYGRHCVAELRDHVVGRGDE